MTFKNIAMRTIPPTRVNVYKYIEDSTRYHIRHKLYPTYDSCIQRCTGKLIMDNYNMVILALLDTLLSEDTGAATGTGLPGT